MLGQLSTLFVGAVTGDSRGPPMLGREGTGMDAGHALLDALPILRSSRAQTA